MAVDLVSILIIVLIVVGVIWVWQNHCSPKIKPVEGIDLREIVESTESTAQVAETDESRRPMQPGGRPAPIYIGGTPAPYVRSRPVSYTGYRPQVGPTYGLTDFVSDPMIRQTATDMVRPFSYCTKRALRRQGNFMTRLHDMSQCLTEAGRLSY